MHQINLGLLCTTIAQLMMNARLFSLHGITMPEGPIFYRCGFFFLSFFLLPFFDA